LAEHKDVGSSLSGDIEEQNGKVGFCSGSPPATFSTIIRGNSSTSILQPVFLLQHISIG